MEFQEYHPDKLHHRKSAGNVLYRQSGNEELPPDQYQSGLRVLSGGRGDRGLCGQRVQPQGRHHPGRQNR